MSNSISIKTIVYIKKEDKVSSNEWLNKRGNISIKLNARRQKGWQLINIQNCIIKKISLDNMTLIGINLFQIILQHLAKGYIYINR